MSDRGYTITRNVDAPREVIWRAWTTPEHFATWFGTEAYEMRDVAFDLRPGGTWHGTMVMPDGSERYWHGVFREVVEPSRLVMDLTDERDNDDEFETYTLTLAGQGPRTEMVLRQSGGHLSDEEYERAKAGTESFMDSLEGLLPGILKARHDAI
jgi:uncharacterized protein YndB with AHSA1/START domain